MIGRNLQHQFPKSDQQTCSSMWGPLGPPKALYSSPEKQALQAALGQFSTWASEDGRYILTPSAQIALPKTRQAHARVNGSIRFFLEGHLFLSFTENRFFFPCNTSNQVLSFDNFICLCMYLITFHTHTNSLQSLLGPTSCSWIFYGCCFWCGGITRPSL